jgi:hypothetical protein
LLSLLMPDWRAQLWTVRLALATGAGLAIYPLLFLWTDLVHLHLGPLYAWLPGLAGLGIIAGQAWMAVRRNPVRIQDQASSLSSPSRPISFFPYRKLSGIPIADLALFVVLALIFSTRFWVIHALDAPMWGDSYHDTMIAQLLADHGGLFNTWQPYAELQTLTYHFGFHTLVVVFAWVTHLPMLSAILWMGQLLNGLGVFTLYPLAVKIGQNRWSGVAAVALAGLITSMPMVYTNWGRYTQLAGQAILPIALLLLWGWLGVEKPGLSAAGSPVNASRGQAHRALRTAFTPLGPFVACCFVLGGLSLTHYRVLIFTVVFLIAGMILFFRRGQAYRLVLRIAGVGIGAGILFLPWFIHVFAGKIFASFAPVVSNSSQLSAGWVQQYNAIGDLSNYLPVGLWLLLPVSVAWSFWRRNRLAAWISLGWFLVILSANPQWFHLPGEGLVSNFAVFIATYIPASLLIGGAFGWLLNSTGEIARRDPAHPAPGVSGGFPHTERVSIRRVNLWRIASRLITYGVPAVLMVMALYGTRQRLSDLRTGTNSLLTRPDLHAVAWIRDNTPQNARFLVNSFFAYGGSVIVGSDGGWWLPLLTTRQSTLPPINYESEVGPIPDYKDWINLLTAEIQSRGVDDPQVQDLLKERGISYAYVGQLQGQVNSGGPLFTPEQLLNSPYFQPVYHQDRVWIFEIR